jgi:hypothetical protein
LDDTDHDSGNTAEDGEQEPLFKWETLAEVAPYALHSRPSVPGTLCEVELASGPRIRVWRGEDRRAYFCHGLTFGGTSAPGGAVSPFSGLAVVTILQNHYRLIDPESGARAGDSLVWRAPGGNTPHSAILLDPVVLPGKAYLDYASKLQTKNGIEPETTMTLLELIEDYYGETYTVYRRK